MLHFVFFFRNVYLEKKEKKKNRCVLFWRVAHLKRKKEEKKMCIFKAIASGNLEKVKCIAEENPESMHIHALFKWTPLDVAIVSEKLEIAQFLFEKGGKPNLEVYCDGFLTPVHWVAQDGCTKVLMWALEKGILPLSVLNIKDENERTPLDRAITCGNLGMVQFLWEKGGRPNLEIYCDRKDTPMRMATYGGYTDTLEWVFTEGVLSLDMLNIKDRDRWTSLDIAIAYGKNLETAKCLWEMGGRPNLEIYHNGIFTPIHHVILSKHTVIFLKWVFAEKVLPLSVLNAKECGLSPLDFAIIKKQWETAALLRRLLHNLDSVILAMQRTKRDRQSTLLRRLPDELLDMVVDEVATRSYLVVKWQ